MTDFWHSFADMAAVEESGELTIERGEGVFVYDDRGRKYLDSTASLWYCAIGHGRGEVADAVERQMRTLETYSTFQDLTSRPTSELAERLADIAPVRGSKVFLTSGGSDSIDTAAKLARRYHQLRGDHDRVLFATRDGSYHGMHLGGTSLAGIEANRAEPAFEVIKAPRDSAEGLASSLDRAGSERVAAFYCEPVIGAGGVFAAPDGYLTETRELCRERGILFIADEVITGFGRCGEWFASGRWGLEPDLITCAKGVTSGYLPLGAVVTAPWVAEPFWSSDAGMWRHGYTYSGHATVAAAALANLAIIEEEGLIGAGLDLEVRLDTALSSLSAHPMVSEIRAGTGAMAAVQLDPAQIEADPSLPPRAVQACRQAGIMTRTLATGAIHVSPPLVINGEELRLLADGIRYALDRLEEGRAA